MNHPDNFEFRSFAVEPEDFASHIYDRFSVKPKVLSPRFFYDSRGSELFEQITRLPEYYPTETEKTILRNCAPALNQLIPKPITLIEPGSGNSEKAELLFTGISEIHRYVPIEISGEHLRERCINLARQYPNIQFTAIDADYMDSRILTDQQFLPDHSTPVIFFPGSSLGNYKPEEAVDVLKQFHKLTGGNGWLLTGIDLKKDPTLLEKAYDDEQGVTESFNKNMIRRMRDELQADISPENFRHHAHYNSEKGRVEIYLISTCNQQLHLNGKSFQLEEDEPILTEYSHKYSVSEFHDLASMAGYIPVETFTDASDMFSVHLMRIKSG